jgi:hypothetical protein
MFAAPVPTSPLVSVSTPFTVAFALNVIPLALLTVRSVEGRGRAAGDRLQKGTVEVQRCCCWR